MTSAAAAVLVSNSMKLTAFVKSKSQVLLEDSLGVKRRPVEMRSPCS